MTMDDKQIELLNSKGLGFLVAEIEQQNTDRQLRKDVQPLPGPDCPNVVADAMWLIIAGITTFFLQTGFAMLCAGLVRAKNTKNILLKNILDACVAALGFWSVGYGFAYGMEGGGNPFIGNTYFFMTNFKGNVTYQSWFYQFAFAATAATIVSGAVAERTKMAAYLCYSLFLTAFVYLIIVHWVWSPAGWLSAFNDKPLLGVGLIDFAGCGKLHVRELRDKLAARPIGERDAVRPREFDQLPRVYSPDGQLVEIPGHSAALQALGTFILWVGWYGFTAGSTLSVTGGLGAVAGRAAATTTLAGASGAVGCLAIFKFSTLSKGHFDLGETLNGVLVGLVSITAGCSLVEPFAAILIGFIASVIYAATSKLVKGPMRIDDVVDAFAVHCGGGMWGLIATALFATAENHQSAYGVPPGTPHGAFYAPIGQGHQMFVTAVIGIVVIWAWTGGLMLPFFYGLKAIGWLRSPPEEERAGMDVKKHGGVAYPQPSFMYPRGFGGDLSTVDAKA